jgi:hypothetical protein
MEEYPLIFKSFLSSILLCSAFLEPLKPKISVRFIIGLTPFYLYLQFSISFTF